MRKFLILISLLSLSVILLSSCGTKYICADGSEVSDAASCPYDELSKVAEREATKYAEDYVKAYVRYLDMATTTVNTYRELGNYRVNFVLSEKSGEAHEVIIQIDRMTGTPSCVFGCDIFIPKINSFSAIYNSSFISERNSRYLNIVYVVEDSDIISCEGTYTTESDEGMETQDCILGKLITEDYDLPVELITSYEENSELIVDWTEGKAAYTLEILE